MTAASSAPAEPLEPWLDAYLNHAADLREAGKIGGISHQEVSNRLHDLGYHVRTAVETQALRISLAVDTYGDAIRQSFFVTRSIRETAKTLGIPNAAVASYVAKHVPDYPVLTRVPRSVSANYTLEELLASMQEAAAGVTGVLSHEAYRKFVAASPSLSDGRRRPGPQGISLRFGTWNSALEAAGLPYNPTAGPPKKFDDPAEVLQSVVDCWKDLEHPPTLAQYDLWQRDKAEHPSPSIVRRILGPWSTTLIRAWQIVHEIQLDPDDAEAVVPPALAKAVEFMPYTPADEEADLEAAIEQAKSALPELEKAMRAHAKLQNLLAAELQSQGFTPKSPGASGVKFDLAFESHDGFLVVAEVKSCNVLNMEGQLRLGLGQVLRYAHQLGAIHSKVRPLLVTQLEPSSDWKNLLAEVGVGAIHQSALSAGILAQFPPISSANA